MIIGEERPFTGLILFKSITVFVLNYLILLGIMLLMVFFNDPAGYSQYLADNLFMLFFTAGCLFLLCWIVYLYYFFDKRNFLTEMKNIWLVFCILDVSIIVCSLCGSYISVYARPGRCLPFSPSFWWGIGTRSFSMSCFRSPCSCWTCSSTIRPMSRRA